MLGTDLVEELNQAGNEVIGWDIDDIDIIHEQDMDKISDAKPDILINCAAYSKVDMAEKEKEECYSINVKGVKNLVDVCKKEGVTLIQISTDYIFDGNKNGYDENDKKNPLNYYGETKSEGEDLIIKGLDNYYILRTSWLFGKNGRNFVKTIIRLSEEKDELAVINDQIGSPTYTKDLSEGIVNLVESGAEYGFYHLTNSGVCSWFDFALEIARLKGVDCKINPCSTNEFPRDAKRPVYSVLNNNKLPKLRIWKEALKEYLEEK